MDIKTNKEIPIGFSTTLANNQNGNFYSKGRQILKHDLSLNIIKDRNIFKEKKSLYEMNSEIFEKQRFSSESVLGIPKIGFMLGISNESTNETKDKSLLCVFDYKYVLTSYELTDLNPETLWNRTTDNFKNEIKSLETENETSLLKTYEFMDNYGTHLIVKCDLGYRFRKMYKTDKNETEDIKDFELDSKLRIMEYFGMSNEYTTKKVTNYNVSSKESETLILGHKSNVVAAIKGDNFDWKTDTTIDVEVIDIHPYSYIPLYQIVPNLKVRENLKKVTEEKEYELAMGWDKGRNYCCAYLETDPGFFTGEFMIDVELDTNIKGSTDKIQRIMINSKNLQKHKLEFIDQKTRPKTLSIDCSRWRKLVKGHTNIRIYYRDNDTYMATIKNIISPRLERLYFDLNWEHTPLDYMINETPKERGFSF
jgi:hypothetical protein